MIGYLILWNTATFCIMGIDKWKAVHNRYRISERFLLSCSFLGGAFGTALAMLVFRHKIRKAKFIVSVPYFCILQIVLLRLVLFD